jgi:hypothetical protein
VSESAMLYHLNVKTFVGAEVFYQITKRCRFGVELAPTDFFCNPPLPRLGLKEVRGAGYGR